MKRNGTEEKCALCFLVNSFLNTNWGGALTVNIMQIQKKVKSVYIGSHADVDGGDQEIIFQFDQSFEKAFEKVQDSFQHGHFSDNYDEKMASIGIKDYEII